MSVEASGPRPANVVTYAPIIEEEEDIPEEELDEEVEAEVQSGSTAEHEEREGGRRRRRRRRGRRGHREDRPEPVDGEAGDAGEALAQAHEEDTDHAEDGEAAMSDGHTDEGGEAKPTPRQPDS